MTKNQIIVYLAVVIAILAFVFLITKPKKVTAPTLQAPETTHIARVVEATSDATGSAKPIVLVVKGNLLVAGPETITVKSGSPVTIKIISDTPNQFHLQGYDKTVAIAPNTPAQISFTADIPGKFTYAINHDTNPLGVLEVLAE